VIEQANTAGPVLPNGERPRSAAVSSRHLAAATRGVLREARSACSRPFPWAGPAAGLDVVDELADADD
jgi:hypothetical protein